MAAQLTRIRNVILIVVVFAVVGSTQAQTLTLKPDVNQLLVAEGALQEVVCSVDNSPTSTLAGSLSWQGPGGTVNQSSVTDSNSDGTFTIHRILSIQSFSSSDAGRYKCTLQPTSGASFERAITLLAVKENKIESEFFWGNKTAALACTLTFAGSSQLQASFDAWYKEGVPISELNQPSRFTFESSNGTLVIDKPTREDAGVYTARYTLTGGAIDSYNCSVEYLAAPLVLDMDKSKNVYREEDLDLECEVKGYPKATVTWLLDQKVLNRSERIMMSDVDGYENAHLHIKSLQDADEGTYTCRATNGANESHEKSIVVRVRDPLEWLWPLIGIIVEVVVLIVIIIVCEKIRKKRELKNHGQTAKKDS